MEPYLKPHEKQTNKQILKIDCGGPKHMNWKSKTLKSKHRTKTKWFLLIIPKAQVTKGKPDKIGSINLKKQCVSKDIFMKVKIYRIGDNMSYLSLYLHIYLSTLISVFSLVLYIDLTIIVCPENIFKWPKPNVSIYWKCV